MKHKIFYVAFLLGGVFLTACAEKTFTKINRCQNFFVPCENKNGMDHFEYSFQVEGKANIEFIVDNSGSMATEHKDKILYSFNDLQKSLRGLKWTANVSTTDDKFTSKNKQLSWETVNPFQILTQTLKRSESIECGAQNNNSRSENLKTAKHRKNTCPSNKESGTYMAKKLVQNYFNNNYGISTLEEVKETKNWIFVMISDEDDYEAYSQAHGGYENKSSFERNQIIQEKVAHFESNLNEKLKGRKWTWHSIIIKPGDQNCLDKQYKQGNNKTFGREGHFYNALSKRRRGSVVNICQSNYSSAFKNIGQDAKKFNTMMLACEDPRDITAIINGKEIKDSDYKIIDKVIEFKESALNLEDKVELKYTCIELS